MLHYAVVFLVIALIAAIFGFGGIAAGAEQIMRVIDGEALPAADPRRQGQTNDIGQAWPFLFVAALMLGLLTMVDTAFEGKDDFYLLDSLDEIKLYNAARNMEIAIWKLSQDRWKSGEQAGRLFLISNELDAANANLSFEREFGRVIGLLDFLARVVADRNGRSFSRLTQNVATMIFLPVGLLK